MSEVAIYNSKSKQNFTFHLVAQVLLFAIGIIKVPLYTHFFAPAALGKYTWCVALLSYIDIIFLGWLNTTLWRFVYNKREFKSFTTLFLQTLPLFGFLAIAALIVVFIVANTLIQDEAKSSLMLIGFFSIVSQQLVAAYLLYFLTNKKIKCWAILTVSQQLAGLVVFLIMYQFTTFKVESIFWATLIVNTVFILFAVLSNVRKIIEAVSKTTFSFQKKLLNYSFLSVLLSTSLLLLNNGDRFFISRMKGDAQLGIYAQYYSLASVGFYAAIQAFNTMVSPAYNKAATQPKLYKTGLQVIELYVLLFTPIVFFLCFNAAPISNLLLSENFKGFEKVFIWALGGFYFFGLGNLLEVRLKYANKISVVLMLLLIVAVINLVCNYFFLQVYIFQVSAIITFTSYLILLIGLAVFSFSFVKRIKPQRLLAEITAATLLYYGLHKLLFFLLPSTALAEILLDFLLAALVYSFVLRKHFQKIKYAITELV